MKWLRKILSFILALLPCFLMTGTVLASGVKEPKTFKVLLIGNSHSRDGATYLYNIATAAGYKEVVVASAYIGGSDLATHVANANKDSANYSYQKWSWETGGVWTHSTRNRMSRLIADDEWDVILMQQQSKTLGHPSTYDDLPALIKYVQKNKTNPNALLGWYMAWAYSFDTNRADFLNFEKNQLAMYSSIVSAVQQKIVPLLAPYTPNNVYGSENPEELQDSRNPGNTNNTYIDFIVPVGTVIQNARDSFLGDTLRPDGYHLSAPVGMYLASLSLFRSTSFELCKLQNIEYQPLDAQSTLLGNIIALPGNYWPALLESVENAAQKPYEVTTSWYKVPPPITVQDQYSLADDPNITISLARSSYTYNTKAHTPTVRISHGLKTLKKDVDFEVNYKENIKAGTATATITGLKYYRGEATQTYTITPIPLENLSIPDPPDATYTGAFIKPKLTIKNDEETLKKNTDYTVSYKENKAAGTAAVTLLGKGNYTGEVTKNFTIKPKSIKKLTYSNVPAVTYDQKARKPAITVTNGKETLVRGIDYELQYKNNTNAGKASIVITGKGNYKRTKTKTFIIKPFRMSKVTINNIYARKYSKKHSPLPKVKHGKKVLKKGIDYTLKCRKNKKTGSVQILIIGKGNYTGKISKAMFLYHGICRYHLLVQLMG